MTLDDISVTRCLFHPRRDYPGYRPQGIATQTHCDGAVVGGYLHDNVSSDTLLMFFHGNGETAADYDGLASLYMECGVSFWVVDYRGYGQSSGEPSYTSMLRDAEMMLADLPRLAGGTGRRYRRVVVMGRSLGSASAIHLAAECPDDLDALILDSPFSDGLALIQRLGGPTIQRSDVPGFVDNIDKIRGCGLPTLILHGTDDRIIPVHEAESLYEAVAGRQKELVKIEGAGHNDLMMVGQSMYFGKIRDWVDSRADCGDQG